MTEFKRTSNDCRFTYMGDFILKPRRKLEYYENASLSKFEEIRVSTPAENGVGNSSVRKGFDRLESSFANHTLGSITSRCSRKKPALLPRTHGWTREDSFVK